MSALCPSPAAISSARRWIIRASSSLDTLASFISPIPFPTTAAPPLIPNLHARQRRTLSARSKGTPALRSLVNHFSLKSRASNCGRLLWERHRGHSLVRAQGRTAVSSRDREVQPGRFGPSPQVARRPISVVEGRQLNGLHRADGAIVHFDLALAIRAALGARCILRTWRAALNASAAPVVSTRSSLGAHVAQTLQTHGSTACGDAGVLHSPASPFPSAHDGVGLGPVQDRQVQGSRART